MTTDADYLDRDHFDALVIGSGFGGAVAACRLAQAGVDVAVVERGRRWRPGGFPGDLSLAGNLSVILQALTGLDHGDRAHAARLRHQLLCVPARVVRHARGLTLRLPPGPQILPEVLARLRTLPTRA